MTYDYERDPTVIYARSFATVRAEARLDHLPGEAHDVAIRVAHACGMPDVTDDLIVSPRAVEAGRHALASGAPILVDAMMVAHGIIRSRLPMDNGVICTLNDERTPALAAEHATTRSAAQVELWRERLDGAIVVIGNAPTALFRLLELMGEGASHSLPHLIARPALVIGMPVGFVGAAESKEALIASDLAHIVVRGRRGGSAMAAAALNALGSEPRAGTARRASGAAASGDARVLIVGTDASGPVAPADRAALACADVVFGPARSLAGLSTTAAQRPWPTPFADGLAEIERRRATGERVAVLASGDPMRFGVGATLAAALGPEALDVRPAPSAHSLAAARLGWALERAASISLHGGERMGRGVATLAQHVAPGRRILALTTDGGTPGEVAAWLAARGFGASTLTVLERMGAADERRRSARADAFDLADIDPLNTLAIECVAAPDATWHPLGAGLSDDVFAHDGQMTKREVRALAVALLRPRPGASLWDVGAGSGSVGLEWLRLSPGSTVTAIEPRGDRRALIAENFGRFGLRADVRAGRIGDVDLDGTEADAVFIGGGLSDGVADLMWPRLSEGGTMVANAVTLEGEAILADLQARHGGTLVRLAMQRAEAVGPFRSWRAAMPVTIWSVVKGAS